jgi:hypothetical protein
MIYIYFLSSSFSAIRLAVINFHICLFSYEYPNYLGVFLNLLTGVSFNFIIFVSVVFFGLIFIHVALVISVLKVKTNNTVEVKQSGSNSNINMMEEDPKKDNEKNKKKKVKKERTTKETIVLVSSMALLFYITYKVFEHLPR